MRLVNQTELKVALIRVGLEVNTPGPEAIPGPADILAAIAMVEGATYEHPGYADLDAVGDLDRVGEKTPDGRTWGPSVTPWQIRTIQEATGTKTVRDRDYLTLTIGNAAEAVSYVYFMQGYTAWTVYRDGKHKAYLPEFYPPEAGTYTVVSGDTYNDIDRKLGLPLSTMQQLNPTPPTQLQIGQKLQLPFVERTIRAGDTLYQLMRIAGWADPIHKENVDRVAKFAALEDSSTIKAGQLIRILKPGMEWMVI